MAVSEYVTDTLRIILEDIQLSEDAIQQTYEFDLTAMRFQIRKHICKRWAQYWILYDQMQSIKKVNPIINGVQTSTN